MCRFLAVMAKDAFEPEPYIRELEMMALNGNHAPHPDGWGIWLRGRGELYHRDTRPVWESEIPEFPRAKVILVHARKRGTGAPISVENVHPFVRNGAVFMHNGLVRVDAEGACGGTDSERLFIALLRDFEGTLGALRGMEVTAANFVMYRDNRLYIFRYATKELDYYTLYIRREHGRVIVSTEGDGMPVENGALCIIDPELNVECERVFRDIPR